METQGELPRKLDAAKAASQPLERLSMDKTLFEQMHAADRMAKEKLAEGIAGFTQALVTLESLLAACLATLEAGGTVTGDERPSRFFGSGSVWSITSRSFWRRGEHLTGCRRDAAAALCQSATGDPGLDDDRLC